MKETKESYNWLKWLIALALIVVIMVIVWMLFVSNETYVTNDASGKNNKIGSLVCKTKESDEAFFNLSQAKEEQHEIKATFKENKLDKMSYNYDGVYETNERAEYAAAKFRVDYDTFMGKKSLEPSILDSKFAAVDNKARVSLFADRDKLNNNTVGFFFLDMDEFQKIKSYSIENLADIYRKKGFDCTY